MIVINMTWITLLILYSFVWQKIQGNQDNDILKLTIEAGESHQTIHSFGASDAWSCQFIGKYWPQEKKEQIADWLFSTGIDEDNNPMGIGLTAWRFNIGGGSAFQGDDSEISDEWRRAESFMTGTDSYDWNKQEGQRWFLRAAQKRGVDQFTGFVNSPPVYLTKNGMGFSSHESRYNLPEENYRLYADFLGSVIDNLQKNDGISLTYVSPFNEPQWDWTNPTQEGTPAQNSEIAALVRILNEVFENRNIESLIEIPETAQFDYLYEEGNRPGRGSQIDAFFNPSSPHYVGNLPHVAQKIAGHSYFTTWPLSRQAEARQTVRKAIDDSPRPIEFWMTEYCVLENNPVIRGNGRDRSMHTALYVARVIWSDLVLGNASSWQWWLGVSPYNYKDGLVYTDYDKYDGNIYDSKLMWVMGNFSRFVRPGMKRVSVSRNDGKTVEMIMEDLMVTAFVTPDNQKITIVLINAGEEQKEIGLSLGKLEGIGELSKYLTDSSREGNLKNTGNYTPGDLLVVPGHSVITITNQH
ncbi:MAG: glycoside hydrolase [Bacteroidales bacterium]